MVQMQKHVDKSLIIQLNTFVIVVSRGMEIEIEIEMLFLLNIKQLEINKRL